MLAGLCSASACSTPGGLWFPWCPPGWEGPGSGSPRPPQCYPHNAAQLPSQLPVLPLCTAWARLPPLSQAPPPCSRHNDLPWQLLSRFNNQLSLASANLTQLEGTHTNIPKLRSGYVGAQVGAGQAVVVGGKAAPRVAAPQGQESKGRLGTLQTPAGVRAQFPSVPLPSPEAAGLACGAPAVCPSSHSLGLLVGVLCLRGLRPGGREEAPVALRLPPAVLGCLRALRDPEQGCRQADAGADRRHPPHVPALPRGLGVRPRRCR